MAFDPITKLMVHALVGGRSEDDAKRFISELARELKDQLPLFTSDELPRYREALAECYSTVVPVPRTGKRGRPPKPVRKIDPDLVYATVHKEREKGRIVKVEEGVVFGSQSNIDAILQASAFSNRVNTSCVERQNLNLRQHNRRLTRKTNGFSKIKHNLETQLLLVMAYYDFVLYHGSLYIKDLGARTPEMAAGIIIQFPVKSLDLEAPCYPLRFGGTVDPNEKHYLRSEKKPPSPPVCASTNCVR